MAAGSEDERPLQRIKKALDGEWHSFLEQQKNSLNVLQIRPAEVDQESNIVQSVEKFGDVL
jgi:hypothetical protein